MTITRIPTYEDGARYVPCESINAVTTRRDPVEPVPIGTYVATVFRVTGYEPDCDGSLMARVEQVDVRGGVTGWEADSIHLHADTEVVLDSPEDLHVTQAELDFTFTDWRDTFRPYADGAATPLGLTLDKPGQGVAGTAQFRAGTYPACSEHGAMNRVAAAPLWRCLNCNIGIELTPNAA